jgi:hypothetical protein
MLDSSCQRCGIEESKVVVINPGDLPVGSPALLATPLGAAERRIDDQRVAALIYLTSSQAFKINRLGRRRRQVRDKLTNGGQRTMVVKIKVPPFGKLMKRLGLWASS